MVLYAENEAWGKSVGKVCRVFLTDIGSKSGERVGRESISKEKGVTLLKL